MEQSPSNSSQSQSPATTPTRVGGGTHNNTTTDTIPGVFTSSSLPVNHLGVTGGNGRVNAVNQSSEIVFRAASLYKGGPLPPIPGSDSQMPNGQAGQAAQRRNNTNTLKDVKDMDAQISNEKMKVVYDFSPDGRYTEEPLGAATTDASSPLAAPGTSTAPVRTATGTIPPSSGQIALSSARIFSMLEAMDIDSIRRVMESLDSESCNAAFNALSQEKKVAFMQSTIPKVVGGRSELELEASPCCRAASSII